MGKIRFIKNIPHIQSIRGRKRSVTTLLKRLNLYINGETDWLGYDIAYINQLSAGRKKYWERGGQYNDSRMLQPFDKVNLSGEVSFENLSVLHLNVLMALIGTIDKLPLINLFDEPGITQYEEGMAIPQIQTVKKEEKAEELADEPKSEKHTVHTSTSSWLLFILAVIAFAYWIFTKEYPQTINYRDHILQLSKNSYAMAKSVGHIIDEINDSTLIEAKVVNMRLHLETVKLDSLNPIEFINGKETGFTQEEIVCCGGLKNVYDYRLRSNDMIADRNWLTIDDLKIIFEEYPIDTEVRDLSMTNRDFLSFDRIGVQTKNKDDLKRALELSVSLSENVLLKKIAVINDPTKPGLKGKLYIAVIREPSSGFWIIDIQSYLKEIKDFIVQVDLKKFFTATNKRVD